MLTVPRVQLPQRRRTRYTECEDSGEVMAVPSETERRLVEPSSGYTLREIAEALKVAVEDEYAVMIGLLRITAGEDGMWLALEEAVDETGDGTGDVFDALIWPAFVDDPDRRLAMTDVLVVTATARVAAPEVCYEMDAVVTTQEVPRVVTRALVRQRNGKLQTRRCTVLQALGRT